MEARVASVRWSAGPTGGMIPTAVLEEPVDFSGVKLEFVSCRHAKFVKDQKIGQGAVIEIATDSAIPYVDKVLEISSNVLIPDRCVVCMKPVLWERDYLVCPNELCHAKAMVPVKRFLETAGIPDDLTPEMLHLWMNRYPLNMGDDEYEVLSNLTISVLMFKQNKLSPKRRVRLMSLVSDGKQAEALWQLECNIHQRLKNGLKNKSFWYLLNLPNLGREEAERLRFMNPIALRKGLLQRLPETTSELENLVPKETVESIMNNDEYWASVAKLFTFTGM